MSDNVYFKLRDILDSIPNGFPSTEDGLEIKILKKIYTEEEAEIATKLKLKFETPETIAQRTGMEKDSLTKNLKKMVDQGQIFGATINGVSLYKLIPFVFGVYEYQLHRMDNEFVELVEEYMSTAFGEEFHHTSPSLMKVVPIEQEIKSESVVEPYQSLKNILENAKDWAVDDCICKKEKKMLGQGCDHPMEVCLGIAPVEDFFKDFFWGRQISKEKAFEILDLAEESGLVHLTSNVKEGHIYICNCCGCCCGMLRGINEMGNADAVAKSNYVAVVDESLCTACGICEERCQINAIEINDYAEIKDKCIGCGLCVTKCPTEAIKLIKRDDDDIIDVPENNKEWNIARAKSRGRDDYKQLLKE